MDQMQIDVEQDWFANRFGDDVSVPDVLKKCAFIGHILSLCSKCVEAVALPIRER